ncbi:cell division protein FtsK/SpoIIIE [Candidatus Vecturithrix granuli]|uniref:Cell division protein FtsK/SpoIIIE n=1 Tax=Vecturithrix granuli TaxID=1499967 RepID=A0A081C4U7_VECG1|nr:cell division protein FtsK/SpoIIIE [Candidatus Vecturithrix granuli]
MNFQERQIQEYTELSTEYGLLRDKIAKLRRGLILETDIAAQFKIEKNIEELEKERKQIEKKLESFEKNGVNSSNSETSEQHKSVMQNDGNSFNVCTNNQKESANYLFREALNYLLSKDYEKSVLTIESVLDQYPDYPGAKELLEEAKENLSTQQKTHIVEEKLEILSQTLQDAQYWHFASLKKARHEFDKRIEDIEKTYTQKIATTKQEFDQSLTKIEQEIKQLNFSSFNAIPWDNSTWNNWTPNFLSSNLSFLCFGKLKEFDQPVSFSVPALFRLQRHSPILFKTYGTTKKLVVATIQSLLLRLLTNITPGRLRFTFIDPVGLGQNIAPFMHLADYDETLINYRAWSEKAHIEKVLVELTEHMENIIQKYLRNTYSTIEEYNEQAGEVVEPYRFLVVIDFPINFTEDAAKRLISISQNGSRCGVYTIILYDTTQSLPFGFNVTDIEQSAIIISLNNEERFIWEDSDFKECQLELEKPPDEKLFNRIIHQVGQMALENSKIEVPFEKLLEKANLISNNWWNGSTIDGIRVPLGPIGATKVQYLDIGKGTAQHALIVGKTGSGKSTLLHVLISTLVLNYSPDEIELYLIDFKKGVEFKIYATLQLPHARVIAIESEREFGLSVLEGLDAELKRRGDICRKVAVDGLKAFRKKMNQKMPRILLLVDEFQEFFTTDDGLASKASQILDRLVRQGRAFGIHVLLGSQTLAGMYTLARSTIDQMAIRIALQCSDADSRLILSDDNPAARLLSRPGEAIYNAANGLIEGNNPFQVAWLPEDKQEYYLSHVKKLAKEVNKWPPTNLIVFEGNAPADAAKNRKLVTHLLHTKPLASTRRSSAWLGEPVAIKETTVANFRRQSGSNLMIVGQNDEAAMGMLLTAVLSLSVQYASERVLFNIIDCGSIDTPHAHCLKYLSDMLPHVIKYGRKRYLPEMIYATAQEVEQRLVNEEESIEKKPTIYLIIYGLQRARDLEENDSYGGGFSFDMSNEMPKPSSPGKVFPKILRDGAEVGIHTLVWCDTLTNLHRLLSRQILRAFDMRVVFQMSSEDSMMLIDSPVASKLGQHRALLYSEEDGQLEKFRPFAIPNERWLQKVGEKLNIK